MYNRKMYKLKSCPFCGLPAEFYQSAYDMDRDRNAVLFWFQVGCVHCNVFPPESDGKVVFNIDKDGNLRLIIDEREKAVEAWNRRAKDV